MIDKIPREPTLNAYSAWLIDLDGTLYRAKPVQICMAMELLITGPRAIGIIRAFRQEHERMRHEAGHWANPYAEQIQRTSVKLGYSRERIERTVRIWMHQRPGKWLRLFARRPLLKTIAEFRALGGRTAIVSDYPAKAKLAAMELDSLFDLVVANGETKGIQSLKPHPSSYLLAAETLGVPAQACLVIGDRADADGQAADAAGMVFRSVFDC